MSRKDWKEFIMLYNNTGNVSFKGSYVTFHASKFAAEGIQASLTDAGLSITIQNVKSNEYAFNRSLVGLNPQEVKNTLFNPQS